MDATITTRRIFIGQDVETHVAQLLYPDFPRACIRERAKEQERVLDCKQVLLQLGRVNSLRECLPGAVGLFR